MLDLAREKCGDEVVEMRQAFGLSAEYAGYELVDEILWDAVAAESTSKRALKRESLFSQFAGFFEKYIDMRGSSCLEHARYISSGSLHHSLRPTKKRSDKPRTRISPQGMAMSIKGERVEMTETSLTEGECEVKAKKKAMMGKKQVQDGPGAGAHSKRHAPRVDAP